MYSAATAALLSVAAADPSGVGGLPEEAGRLLRGSEAVPEECVRAP